MGTCPRVKINFYCISLLLSLLNAHKHIIYDTYTQLRFDTCIWKLVVVCEKTAIWLPVTMKTTHDHMMHILLCSTVFYSATMVCACASYSILHKISTTPTMRVVFLCNIGRIPSVLLIFSLQYILCIMSNVCCMYTSINLGLPQ